MNSNGISNLPNGHQIRNHIFQHLRQQPPPPAGWQQTTTIGERANSVFTLYSQLLLLLPGNPSRCLGIAHNFENAAFRQQPSKDQYSSALSSKQEEIAQSRRNKVESGMQLNNMAPAGMMPPNNMQNPMPGQAPAQGTQGFNPQLQRPMQATPLSQNPQNPYAQGMPNAGMTSIPQHNGQNLQPQQPSFTDHEIAQINAIAQQKTQSMTPEDRNRFMQSLPPQQRDTAQRVGANPIFVYWRQQVMKQAMQRKAAQQQNNNTSAPGHNAMPGMGGMQGPQSGFGRPPQQMSTNQAQPNNYQDGQDVSVAQILGQQADAQKSQDAGHLVVPASNNPNAPQQMAAQQPMGAQNQMTQQQMFNNQQFNGQQNAARAQQARNQQQIKAAQAAQARNMSLQGQIGGLNGSQPPQQSPAMPNLNRPMVPPGGNTPQPRPQQAGPPGMQPSPVPMENRMSQQGQMGFPNQQGPGPLQNGLNSAQMNRAAQIPAQLSANIKQKLMALPDHQFQPAIRSLQAQMAAKNSGIQAPGQPPFPMQPGRPQMQQNPLQPGQLQLNGQGQVPKIGPGQQQPPQPGNARPLSQIQRAFLESREKITEWDQKPLPAGLRPKIPNLPDQAQTWGQVKNFVSNSPLPPTFANNILNAQSQQFEQFIIRQRQAAGLNQATPVGNMPNQNAMSMPANGPAPPAPMVAPGQQQIPPQARMGVPQQTAANININNNHNMNLGMISAHEVAMVRSHYGARAGSMSDDELRRMIYMSKLKQHPNQQNAAAIQQLANPMSQQSNLGPNLMQQVRPPAVLQPPQPQPTPNMKPQNKPPQVPTKPSQQTSPAQTSQNQRGQKRPASNDDVVEVPPPKAAKLNEAPNMQQSKSQQGMPKMTPDQMANLKPEDTAKLQEQLRQQAMAKVSASANKQSNHPNGTSAQAPNSTGSDLDKLRRQRAQQLVKEIGESITKNSTPKTLRHDQLHQAHTLLQRSHKQIDTSTKLAYTYYSHTADENLTRQVLQPIVLAKAVLAGINTNKVPATPEDLHVALNAMSHSSRIVYQRLNAMGVLDKPVQAQAAAPDGSSESQTQLNAANLRQHQNSMDMARQASLHKRSNSKTPSAPTTSQPPVQFGALSPHGTPIAYGPPPELTSDKLKLPPNKRRKTQTGSAASTPGQPTPASISSPQITKSPEAKRAPAPEPAKPLPPKNVFKCQDDNCEYKVRGFETQQALDKHNIDMHPVIDDPLSFAINSVAEADGCNLDGTLKHPTITPNSKKTRSKDNPIQKAKPTGVGPKNAVAATPMARSATQPGAQASPSKTPLDQAPIKTAAAGSGAAAAKPSPVKTGAGVKRSADVYGQDNDVTFDPRYDSPPPIPAFYPDISDPDQVEDPDEHLYRVLRIWNKRHDGQAPSDSPILLTALPPEETPELTSPGSQDDSPPSNKPDAAAAAADHSSSPAAEGEKEKEDNEEKKAEEEQPIDSVIDYENPKLPDNPFPPSALALDFFDPLKDIGNGPDKVLDLSLFTPEELALWRDEPEDVELPPMVVEMFQW